MPPEEPGVAPAEPPPELPEELEPLPDDPELPLDEGGVELDEGGVALALPLWVGVLALGQPVRTARQTATDSRRAASVLHVLPRCISVCIFPHHIFGCHRLSVFKPWPERFVPNLAQ